MPGTLFVVATPIGNLEDLTFRALRVLKEVDLIAAEDTRRTSKLLAHYGVSKPLVSLHEHNEHREAPRLVARMAAGESVALVSDAGTPAISDPGTTLVRLSRDADLQVVPIPGPSAITAALSVTGLAAVPFTFLGFPPASGQDRARWFDSVSDAPGVAVFFESPHRIRRTLQEMGSLKRPIYIHREISKIHEELVKWNNSNTNVDELVIDKGEFVVVVGPHPDATELCVDDSLIVSVFRQVSSVPFVSELQATMAAAAVGGIPASRVKNIVRKSDILAKRPKSSDS